MVMPSGTMAQQIALRIWCERRGLDVGRVPSRRATSSCTRSAAYERLHGLRAVHVGDPNRLIGVADLERDRRAGRGAPARAAAARARRAAAALGRPRRADRVGARARRRAPPRRRAALGVRAVVRARRTRRSPALFDTRLRLVQIHADVFAPLASAPTRSTQAASLRDLPGRRRARSASRASGSGRRRSSRARSPRSNGSGSSAPAL